MKKNIILKSALTAGAILGVGAVAATSIKVPANPIISNNDDVSINVAQPLADVTLANTVNANFPLWITNIEYTRSGTSIQITFRADSYTSANTSYKEFMSGSNYWAIGVVPEGAVPSNSYVTWQENNHRVVDSSGVPIPGQVFAVGNNLTIATTSHSNSHRSINMVASFDGLDPALNYTLVIGCAQWTSTGTRWALPVSGDDGAIKAVASPTFAQTSATVDATTAEIGITITSEAANIISFSQVTATSSSHSVVGIVTGPTTDVYTVNFTGLNPDSTYNVTFDYQYDAGGTIVTETDQPLVDGTFDTLTYTQPTFSATDIVFVSNTAANPTASTTITVDDPTTSFTDFQNIEIIDSSDSSKIIAPIPTAVGNDYAVSFTGLQWGAEYTLSVSYVWNNNGTLELVTTDTILSPFTAPLKEEPTFEIDAASQGINQQDNAAQVTLAIDEDLNDSLVSVDEIYAMDENGSKVVADSITLNTDNVSWDVEWAADTLDYKSTYSIVVDFTWNDGETEQIANDYDVPTYTMSSRTLIKPTWTLDSTSIVGDDITIQTTFTQDATNGYYYAQNLDADSLTAVATDDSNPANTTSASVTYTNDYDPGVSADVVYTLVFNDLDFHTTYDVTMNYDWSDNLIDYTTETDDLTTVDLDHLVAPGFETTDPATTDGVTTFTLDVINTNASQTTTNLINIDQIIATDTVSSAQHAASVEATGNIDQYTVSFNTLQPGSTYDTSIDFIWTNGETMQNTDDQDLATPITIEAFEAPEFSSTNVASSTTETVITMGYTNPTNLGFVQTTTLTSDDGASTYYGAVSVASNGVVTTTFYGDIPAGDYTLTVPYYWFNGTTYVYATQDIDITIS